MNSFVLILPVLICFVTARVSGSCMDIPETGMICYGTSFSASNLIHGATYKPIEISFLQMISNVNLTIPKEFSNRKVENAVFKKFYIAHSCVTNIEDDFFRNLDRNNSALEEIVFENVTCLNKLSTKSFRGIGAFLKVLKFESMLDVVEIDSDFFETFKTLQKLTITNTSIRTLPRHILLNMPNLDKVDLSNNQLAELPLLPKDDKDFLDKINVSNNPFHCDCSLKPMVLAMQKILSTSLYKCSSPEKYQGQPLIEVALCSQQSVTEKRERNDGVVAKAHVRIEIIIAVSLVILVLVVIIIVVVLYKRYTKEKKKQNQFLNQGSPSKIVFQNDPDAARPFIYKYQE